MATTVRTEITINASAEAAWEYLGDASSYAQWNPFMTRIGGTFAKGAKILLTAKPKGKPPLILPAKVTVYEPNREVRWVGSLIVPGIFDGEHFCQLVPSEDGKSCTFVHGEVFSGVLASLLAPILKNLSPDYERMNEALKKAAEG